jgi:ribonucleoside-diphosphate reductase alpha chain
MSLPTEFQQYIHLSRYSRYRYEDKRRETWDETVDRYFDFFKLHLKEMCEFNATPKTIDPLREAILGLKVMPSMRCLMTAGEALRRENVSGYNCSYIVIDSLRSFDELLYVLMNGTGVGFSVERQYVNHLPIINEEFFDTDTILMVSDSKLGWAKALKELIYLLAAGQIPKWNLSRIRPAGSPLKTFGGRASGPEPLEDLFHFCVSIFRGAAGRKLTSLECHDICCKIAEVVVVGGVRRSALISLSNLSDDRMRLAKSGRWWESNQQRALANNSAAYTEKPDMGIFMTEWQSLYESKSGERGMFNRAAAKIQASLNGRRDPEYEFGTNPCSEIILRDREFCNLTEIVIRENDTEESLKEKVKIATILGTWQSTLTNFKYLNKKWRENCEEERLLGVSMTGIMDCQLTNHGNGDLSALLQRLKKIAIDTNREWAKKLNINASAAITCVKPSGTVSQLTDTASGIHARHNPYYVRTVRADKKDPLAKMMHEAGFPCEDDVTKPMHTWVFSFPIKGPKKGIYRKDMSAIEHLELWKIYQDNWCEHKPSITVSVKEDEWMSVGAWTYENFEMMSGVSFLPMSDYTYRQAPYQDCSKQEYEELVKKMPVDVDWTKLTEYEHQDMTAGSQELACSADGGCEVVDLITVG